MCSSESCNKTQLGPTVPLDFKGSPHLHCNLKIDLLRMHIDPHPSRKRIDGAPWGIAGADVGYVEHKMLRAPWLQDNGKLLIVWNFMVSVV